jgi:hypothetical protein
MAPTGPEWRNAAHDLGAAIARSPAPVTFLIGAGASLSSGAPTTTEVANAFHHALHGRLAGTDVKSFLHLIPESEKQEILAPLFRGVRPYIGYFCLAALGRHRRVRVLNLNWDNALEQACRALDVPYTVSDLSHAKERKTIELASADPGVDIVHVHGVLGKETRFETLRTLKFSDNEHRFLRRHFLTNTLVIAGASVIYDTDLQALFFEERGRRAADELVHRGQWYFGRPDTMPLADSVRRSQLPRGVLGYLTASDFDFDEWMIRVLGSLLDADWSAVRNYRSSLALPALDALAWPEPALLRPILISPTVALIGQARLGKTVLAHLLAYLKALWNSSGSWGQGALPMSAVDGPSDAVAALSSIVTGEWRAYVIENPFGVGQHREGNPAFIDLLQRIDQTQARSPTIVIASRLSDWPDDASLRAADITISASSPSEWYSPASLRAYTTRIAPQRRDVADQIVSGGIQTPAKINDILAGVPFSASSLRGDEAEVGDKLALLEGSPPLARLCSALRLQEFCGELLSRHDLEAVVGSDLGSLALGTVVAHRFSFEGIDRWRLGHDTDREAADLFIGAREAQVREWISDEGRVGERLRAAFEEWKLVAGASKAQWDAIENAPASALRNRAPDLLKIATVDDATLNLLAEQQYDPWEIKDLSYELVRRWNDLGGRTAGRSLLNRVLSDHQAAGTYGVLEACLYMQGAASDELWRKVYGSLDDLVIDPAETRQLTLAVDALTWRPPPEPYRAPSWARKFIQELAPSQPSWALVRFLAGYHGSGLSFIEMERHVETDSTHQWTSEQAAFASWLIRWHFIHQSRARAQFARQPWVDKDFLCRSLHPQPMEAVTTGANRLLRSFLGHEQQAGWGFFLGCNLAAIGHGIDSDGEKLTSQLLQAAGRRSDGVIAAALTYGTASRYANELRRYFTPDDNREALLDGMRDGLLVDGLRLKPPSYVVNRDPIACYLDTGLDWGNLKTVVAPVLPPTSSGHFDLSNFIRMMKDRLDDLPDRQRRLGREVLQRAETGDLRILDAAAAARASTRTLESPAISPDALMGVLNRAVTLLAAEQATLI